MLKLRIDQQSVIDLFILWGEQGINAYFEGLKEETLNQIDIIKESEEFKKYEKEFHNMLLEKAKSS